MPAAASALLGLVKHRRKPTQAPPHPAHPNGSRKKNHFSSQQKKTQPYLPNFAMKQPNPGAEAATGSAPACPNRKSQTHCGGEEGLGSTPALRAISKHPYTIAHKCRCPKPILAPSKAQLGRMELPTWQHQTRAGPSPAEPQQALTCQAEPTWSKPQATLRAGSADPGREEGQIQETAAGKE